MIRYLYLTLLVIVTLNCQNHHHFIKPLSETQRHLDSLAVSYQKNYSNANNKNSVVEEYHLLLHKFLMDSLKGGIDSIRVTVDSVIENNYKITTSFHTDSRIAFKYTLGFKKNMRSDWDSLYNFMKSLRPNSDTTIGFIYFGSHEINDPDTTLPIFRFFAFPVPLNFGKK